jgi:hypothetical protein
MTLKIRPDQDGMGYFYGEVVVDGERYTANLLPPQTFNHAFFVSLSARRSTHPTHWQIFVDGNLVSMTETREEAERALKEWRPASEPSEAS